MSRGNASKSTGFARRLWPSMAAVCVLSGMLNVAGCDAPPPPPEDPPAPKKPASAPTADLTNKTNANMAEGRVLNAEGGPLDMTNRRAVITISGSATGTERQFRAVADKDGKYSTKIEPGPYLWPSGMIEFSFRDNQYRLPLTPTRTPNEVFALARDGVSMDFCWKLSGLRPGLSAVDNPDAWIGGAIYPELELNRADQGRMVRPPPPGTKAIFTLTPKGPMADGSVGAPREVTMRFDESRIALDPDKITDIPLAYYELRGIERFPDGRTGPLLFRQKDGTWAESVEGTFEPNFAEASLRWIKVKFTRKYE